MIEASLDDAPCGALLGMTWGDGGALLGMTMAQLRRYFLIVVYCLTVAWER